jgi:dihydropteroate synthase
MLDLTTKSTAFSESKTLQCGEKLLNLSQPAVMGILNLTPDSFYDGGRYNDQDACLSHAEKMIEDGAAIIDLGAVSTRPGAAEVLENEEKQRLIPVLGELVKRFPETIFSVDTYRSGIARIAIEQGACMINDISGGEMDKNMFPVMAKLSAAYIVMHMKGTPATMQINPEYLNVTTEVHDYLSEKINNLKTLGIHHIVADPGFGFGKTIRHNYTLLHNLHKFSDLGVPLLVGISRKSMIYKYLKISPNEALNGTTVIQTIALLQGADILRVHDVKEAVEAIRIVHEYFQAGK